MPRRKNTPKRINDDSPERGANHPTSTNPDCPSERPSLDDSDTMNSPGQNSQTSDNMDPPSDLSAPDDRDVDMSSEDTSVRNCYSPPVLSKSFTVDALVAKPRASHAAADKIATNSDDDVIHVRPGHRRDEIPQRKSSSPEITSASRKVRRRSTSSDRDARSPSPKRKSARPEVHDDRQWPYIKRERSSRASAHKESRVTATPPPHVQSYESPISKLVHMVNNPETIVPRRKTALGDYLVPRAPHHYTTSAKSGPRSQSKSTFSSPATSSTSKNMSRFSGLYSRMQKLAGLHPLLLPPPFLPMPSLGGLDPATLSMFAAGFSPPAGSGPYDDSDSQRSDTRSAPVVEQEEPLDLSVRPKGLDLTKKHTGGDPGDAARSPAKRITCEDKRERTTRHDRERTTRHDRERTTRHDRERTTHTAASSLKTLEEKFGANSLRLDAPIKSPQSYLNYVHPLLPLYGGALYSNALFNSHPWMFSDKLLQNSEAIKSGQSNCKSSAVATPATTTKSSSTITSNTAPSKSRKCTAFKCSCRKEYETLYDLTVHLKESGHTPSSRSASASQEFPKLVRGQDMWLNQGQKQTSQILRCMQCGESFTTLPDLTLHMIETKHYTNIVGMDAYSTVSSGSGGKKSIQVKVLPTAPTPDSLSEHAPSDTHQTFRCAQCFASWPTEEAFLKHSKESGHPRTPLVLDFLSRGSSPVNASSASPSEHSPNKSTEVKRDQPCEKKAPPSHTSHTLARLLEVKRKCEQALQEVARGMLDPYDSSLESLASDDSKMCCETCHNKLDMASFVNHVRECASHFESSAPLKKRRVIVDDEQTIENGPSKRDGNRAEDRERDGNRAEDRERDGNRAEDRERDGNRAEDRDGSATIASYRAEDRKMLLDDLVQVQADEDGSSALKAMESFIHRSFMPSNPRRSHLNVKPKFSLFNGHFGLPSYFRESHDEDISRKYLPPLFASPDVKSDSEEKMKPPEAVKVEPRETGSQAKPKKMDRQGRDRLKESPHNTTGEIARANNTSSEMNPLNSPPPTESNGTMESNQTTDLCIHSTDDHSDPKPEHPLDSLQRFISLSNPAKHSTTEERPSAFTALTLSPPARNKEDRPVHKSKHVPSAREQSESAVKTAPDGSESKVGTDHCCKACNRNFASVGAYRYHKSRCHLGVSLKGSQAVKVTVSSHRTDPSSRFSKYYQMASELASRTK